MSKRVLIVDDEEWICAVLEDYLQESGYTVNTSLSLDAARKQMGQGLPDAVVVDMSLPDGSGLSLIEEMRSNKETKDIPIILITAHASHKIDHASPGNKPDDCIVKPFNLSDFKTRLEKQLNNAL